MTQSITQYFSNGDSEASAVRRRAIALSNNLSLEQCIGIIGNLSDIFLESALGGVQLEFENNKLWIINMHRIFRRSLAVLLFHTVLRYPRQP